VGILPVAPRARLPFLGAQAWRGVVRGEQHQASRWAQQEAPGGI